MKTALSAAFGTMSSFSAQLHAVGEALQQAEGTVHVGADAVLHPGHHAALPPDVEQREQHQDQEDQHGLDDDQPRRVVTERAQGARGRRDRGDSLGTSHDGGDRDRAAGRADEVPHRRGPGRWPGAQTVPSARSATPTGRSTEPSGPVSVTTSPTVAPSAASVAGPTSTTGLRAVGAHRLVAVLHPAVVEQLLPGGQHQAARRSATERRRPCSRPPQSRDRSPSHGPTWTISSHACSVVRKPSEPGPSPRRCRPAPAGRAASWGCAAPCRTGGPGPPS